MIKEIINNKNISSEEIQKLDTTDGIRNKFYQASQETRFNILVCILMHPKNSPTLKEIDFMNQYKSKTTLREHLDVLIRVDIVDKVELPNEKSTRDNPSVFFTLTRGGQTILRRLAVLNLREFLQRQYAKSDKPEVIERYEQAPRPDFDEHLSASSRKFITRPPELL